MNERLPALTAREVIRVLRTRRFCDIANVR